VVQRDFLELNDLAADQVQEMHIEQQQPMQADLNLMVEEENLMQLADQEMQHIHVVYLDEGPEDINLDDINLDELIGLGGDGFPKEVGFH
jgi:hypothetical protein